MLHARRLQSYGNVDSTVNFERDFDSLCGAALYVLTVCNSYVVKPLRDCTNLECSLSTMIIERINDFSI